MIFAESVDPSPSNWDFFGNEIYAIEQSIFGEKSFNEETMKKDINNPKISLVLLKDNESVVGFSYALPEGEKVVCINDTVIAKEYQGKGFVSLLMSCMEKELKKRGYEYITRDAMVENGYADKIMKNYTDRIIETKDFVGDYGEQRYFKIRI